MDLAASRARFAAAGRFDGLDGWRALGILAVLGHHVAGGRDNPVFDRGLGVTIFFAISGFVITALLLRELRRTGTIQLGAFYVRRSLRIFPLYFAVLFLYVALVALAQRNTPAGQRFFSDLPFFATFTSNWLVVPGQHSIFYFAWSLATQEQFYLVWPLVLRWVRRWWAPPAAMGVLLLAGELARHRLRVDPLAASGLGIRVLAYVPASMCMGAVAACLLERAGTFQVAWRVLTRSVTVPLALLVLALPSFVELGAAQLPVSSLAIVVLIAAGMVRAEGRLLALLEAWPLRLVGRVSYGIYLFHMLALNLSRRLMPGRGTLTLFLSTGGLSLLAAAVSYSRFERPIMAAGRRWLQARAQAVPGAGAPPGG